MPGPETRTALITGATDGLGRALAGELAEAGWSRARPRPRRGARRRDGGGARRAGAATSASSAPTSPRSTRCAALADRVEAETDRLDVARLERGDRLRRERPDDASRAWTATSSASPSTTSRGTCSSRRSSRCSALGARADRQRRLGRPGRDRLRRRDAGAELHGRPGLLPEQARAGDVHVRPRGGARRHRRDRDRLHPATFMPTKMVLEAGISPTLGSRTGSRRRFGSSPTPSSRA